MTATVHTATRLRRASTATAALTTALALCLVPGGGAAATGHELPLGDADLVETRSSRILADGVTLTRIVRGTEPAPADEIGTTTRGPWVVNVLTIDPHATRGHLKATHGPDLGHVEKTTELVRSADALAGVNASFFTFRGPYPGDPVGLSIHDGKLLSEPVASQPNEVDLVVDAYTNRLMIGHLSWSGSVRNRQTEASLPLEFVNHPPVVPADCATLTDQTQCALPGDVVLFTPEFAPATPSGAGVEVVLDRLGCVVTTSTSRGSTLAPDQTSLQATGRDSAALLALTAQGCLHRQVALFDEDGEQIALRPGLYGVVGRYWLTEGGQIVVPDGSGGHFLRHPRTIAGTTADGRIMLVTIDGRRTTSVGATMDEAAAVAHALGLHGSVSLDGGGSTAMSVEGSLVNQPSGSAERAVGDALVFIDAPYSVPADR